jgi:hypothetical protein
MFCFNQIGLLQGWAGVGASVAAVFAVCFGYGTHAGAWRRWRALGAAGVAVQVTVIYSVHCAMFQHGTYMLDWAALLG